MSKVYRAFAKISDIKNNLPKFGDVPNNLSYEDTMAELNRRMKLIEAAWPDDLDLSDDDLNELGAVDVTNHNNGVGIIIGKK